MGTIFAEQTEVGLILPFLFLGYGGTTLIQMRKMEPVFTNHALVHRLTKFAWICLFAHTKEARKVVIVSVVLVGGLFFLKQCALRPEFAVPTVAPEPTFCEQFDDIVILMTV